MPPVSLLIPVMTLLLCLLTLVSTLLFCLLTPVKMNADFVNGSFALSSTDFVDEVVVQPPADFIDDCHLASC